jgi:FAD/FMN-containing dehydrogenase
MYFVPSDSLEALVDVVYGIVRLRFSDELFITSGSYLASLLAADPEDVPRLSAELPPWVALVGIAGRDLLPAERVAAHEESIADIVRQANHEMVDSLAGVQGATALSKVINPSGADYWKETARGGFQEIFFVTTMDKAPEYVDAMRDEAIRHGYPVQDLGVYIQPQHMGTSCHLEFLLPYDPGEDVEAKRVSSLFDKASRRLSGMGAYFARPYGIWSQLQLNKDDQSYTTLKKLKSIFDPRDVMNPGKLYVD